MRRTVVADCASGLCIRNAPGGSLTLPLLRLQRDAYACRSDAIYNDLKRARTALTGTRNVELGIGRSGRPYTHGREIVAAGKADSARAIIGNAYQREVGRGLRVVAIGAAEIEAVEVGAGNSISRAADIECRRHTGDHGQPGAIWRALRRIDCNLGAVLTIIPQDLAVRQRYQVAGEVGAAPRCLRIVHLGRGYRSIRRNIELPKMGRCGTVARAT